MTEVTITQEDRQFIYDLMMPCASNELEKLALEFIRDGRGDDAPAVQLAARHRTLTPAQAAGPVLLEKVAKAIMDYRSPLQSGTQWAIETEENREWYRGLAGAALTAITQAEGPQT